MRLPLTATALLLLLSAMLAVVLACPAPADNPLGLSLLDPASAPVFEVQHKQTAITIKQGQEFVIKLDSNPTTGYTWMLKENKTPDHLEFLGCSYERYPHPEHMVGTGGADSWGFKATAAGQVVLELQKVRPWVHPRPKEMDASIIITVE